MAEVTVQIELDTDTGKIMVGMVPPEAEAAEGQAPGKQPAEAQAAQLMGEGGEESAEASYMKPVRSIDEALSIAKDMLAGQSGAQAQAANADEQMAQGFGKQQPASMMARQGQ